ncbi:tRNA (adenosine(37)-N6)-threonylcarbamoyltransferase complex ATPase subunit type 1 TsaE [uncultured Kocuria sp.]|uniref:tRNA (adenosine(37)-N6)-threonylcarbamoyltransferase complex ATPase subunit type 1 TsaE n=1 Tax=uncultured Kocuria sp. TaxID=259305 RepID=UPI00260337DE|nr:tRNA (adenosine(37)-N6)-threonylcarbamoyltransferase complex ATPase subunit type 1 TsaE [uncultured Kocuria sp.]
MSEWTRTVTVDGPGRTQALAERLGGQLRAGDLLVLTGELGAGKTTFTQGLGRGLGVREGIISPTFVLVRRHPNVPDGPRPGGPDLVHVDAYRLGSAAEVDDIDLEDTVDTAVTVVEWGTGKVEHLAESRLEIVLERAVGAAPLGPGAPCGPAEAADDPGGPVDDAEDRDEDRDEDPDEEDEPRRITLTGIGPRWADGPPRLD